MRALVLSGGGFRGAVQVPVILHLADKYSYDAVYGVSVGSLNGVMFAMSKLDELVALWNDIDGIGGFLRFKWWWPFNGLYSMKPLRRKIEQYVSLNDILFPFYAGLVSLNTGKYYNYGTPDMHTDEELWGAIEASSCIVGMMVPPQIPLYGETHTAADGGFRNIIPVPDTSIYTNIDIVTCTPLERVVSEYKKFNTILDSGARGIELMEDEIFHRDYLDIFNRLPEDGQVTIYAPQASPRESFKASKELIEYRFALGRDAIKHPLVLKKDLVVN